MRLWRVLWRNRRKRRFAGGHRIMQQQKIPNGKSHWVFLCKDSFVNTMNTKMSITVRNDGRLVFTFTNGGEETVMM
jgi:hypothetical protein